MRPRFIAAIDKALPWTSGLLSAAALFSIMWLTLADVTGRKFLNHSVPGGLEITEILMVIVIFGALPLVSWRGEHVVFDSLDRWIPDGLKLVQARLVHLSCAGLFGLMAWLLLQRGRRFAEYGEITVHLQLPMGPVAWLMAVLLLLTALVHVVLMIWPPPPSVVHAPGEGHVA
jgi:TRAP-type transport system small permease protein